MLRPRLQASHPLDFLLVVGFFCSSVTSMAQTPSINNGGVVESSTYSSQLTSPSDWSIFGSNLTNYQPVGPGQQVSSQVHETVRRVNFIDTGYYSASTNNRDWFESTSQINFYATIGGSFQNTSLIVCNSLSDCSPQYYIN